jgi:hypothetical protein
MSVDENGMVGTFKVNAVWTPEMIEDLKNFKYIDYAAEETRLIKEYQMIEKMMKRDSKIDDLLG